MPLWRLQPVDSSNSPLTISSTPFDLGREQVGAEFQYVSRLHARLHSDGDGAVLEARSEQPGNYTGHRAQNSSAWQWLHCGERKTLCHGDFIALDRKLPPGSVFRFESESESLGLQRPRDEPKEDAKCLPCGDPRREAAGLPKFASGCKQPCCVTGRRQDSQDDDDDDEEVSPLAAHGPMIPRSDKAERSRPAKKRPHQFHTASQKKRHEEGLQHGIALADKYEAAHDDNLSGFVAMEKYDGHRAIWRPEDGVFVSRQGGRTKPPPSFAALLPPDLVLDGELWAGRGQFQRTSSLVRASDDASWSQLKYVVYDAPFAHGTFVERIEGARAALARTPADRIHVAPMWPCEDVETKDRLLQQMMESDGDGHRGEGLILRRGSSLFRAGVSDARDMLKVKPMADAEAVIIRKDQKAADRQKGSVRVRVLNGDACGKEFNITNIGWESKPPGTVVTFVYQHGLDNGTPRHAYIDRKHEYTCECAACEGWRQEKERLSRRGRGTGSSSEQR